jgi:hypothetical protein
MVRFLGAPHSLEKKFGLDPPNRRQPSHLNRASTLGSVKAVANMAIKPFEQVFPGQNKPNLQPKKGKNVDPAEWERRQRLKEYRIAARREKRNRKSDEKKQRKLNATILRRMV